jgi:hypothetical protein
MVERGRPKIEFTQEMADRICDRLAIGRSLRSVCADEDTIGITTCLKWLRQHEAFAAQYARAREIQAEYLVDEIIEIADDGTNDYMAVRDREGAIIGWRENGEFVNRSKLRIDARKWQAAKMLPKKYGDKSGLLTDADDPNTLKIVIVNNPNANNPIDAAEASSIATDDL